MRFAFTEEQEALRDVVRTAVERNGGPTIREPADGPGFDEDLWSQLSGQVGVCGLAVPEAYGGDGFSLLEALIVVEELGRGLARVPYLGGLIAAEALQTTGNDPECARLLPPLARGEKIASLAWAEPGIGWRTDDFTTAAALVNGRWWLTGRKVHVLDGSRADTVLVIATTDDGPALFAVDPGSVVATTPLDPTRQPARVELDDTPGTWLGRPDVHRVLEVAAAAVAVESVGAAQRWLHETVEYAKVRTQFGRPIGSFQALKHRLADRHVDVEAARSLSHAASWAVAARDERAPELTAMAKSACTECYQAVAAEGIQLHGGIGITWEHEAHLHLKRAHANAQLFGTPSHHRAALLG
ncbi:acyl-CoA dehydrogenase family protein [Saccharopolyspora halophila]|uniref:Acyl-CoA dehydrogenase family protein n=1 Tax=Saccharopolyspora halophila TaxID=405551 RepID=A0ABP5T124_9PSEU